MRTVLGARIRVPGVIAMTAAFTLATTVAVGSAPEASAATGPYGTNVILDGHGNGHGIGLSQWGALGYAVDEGWNAEQILAHYYGGTVGSSAPDGPITVRLTTLDDLQTAVVQLGAQATTATDPLARTWGSIVAREISPSTFRVWARPDAVCPAATDNLDDPALGWTVLADTVEPVTIATSTDTAATADVNQLLAVCEPSGTVRSYRGTIRAVNGSAGENRTVNEVSLELYLRSVVASEVPAGWASLGGGRGVEALRAQAVAARSYAHNQTRYSYAQTCDTQACQVYAGAARRSGIAGVPVLLENPQTDAAVAATAEQVRRTGSASGPIANTMFSSSSGGYSAPSSSPGFPAVIDAGDDVVGNPHHSWTTLVPVSSVEAKWPSIGALQQITVTKRNGLGDQGGRVLTMVIQGSIGQVIVTGDEFRIAMGLRSNWFAVRSPCFGRDEPVVTGTVANSVPVGLTATAPKRVIDSRNALGTEAMPLLANCTLAFDPGPAPAGAAAAAITVTTTLNTADGFTTAYPCATPRPNVSAVQPLAGLDIPGTTVVPLGPDGRICLYSSVTTDVIVDVLGWFTPSGARFTPSSPERLLDSRRPLGAAPIPAATTTRVQLTGAAASAAAVSVNLTATRAEGSGYVTAFPCTGAPPTASVLNVRPGADIANHAFVALDASGGFCLWNSVAMHLIGDVDGWFGSAGSQGLTITAPTRAVDTRNAIGTTGALAAGETRPIALGSPVGARGSASVMFELTAVDPAAPGYVTAFPCGSAPPDASVLNAPLATNVANLVIMPTDSQGRVCFYASMPTQLLVDVIGRG